MIAVDINDTAELHAAGIRALNEALGADGAQAFIKQFFGGKGDYTKDKYSLPDLTEAERSEFIAQARAEAGMR